MRFGFMLLLLVWIIGFSSKVSAQEVAGVSNDEHLSCLVDRIQKAKSIKADISGTELLKLMVSSKEIVYASDYAHQKWLEDRVKEAKSVKVGMSRADLLKLFVEEGGFQGNPPSHYVLKSCPEIHVEVTFNVVAGKTLARNRTNVNDLRIQTISPVYLDWVVSD